MSEFTEDFQSIKPSFPVLDIDPNVELVNQFADQFNIPSVMEYPSLNFHTYMPFTNDGYLFSNQEPEFPAGNMAENFPKLEVHRIVADGNESKKRIAVGDASQSSSGISTPQFLKPGLREKIAGRGKRVKSNEKEDEKPKEVVHVRARRGQATDSHSLAERARRGKINERLRCLQEIVPGCSNKTMGMAVMLDEIINYVQSLQNQIEFLSMRLAAASSFYDFNSNTDATETMQMAAELERLKREAAGYGGFGASFQSTSSTWSP